MGENFSEKFMYTETQSEKENKDKNVNENVRKHTYRESKKDDEEENNIIIFMKISIYFINACIFALCSTESLPPSRKPKHTHT